MLRQRRAFAQRGRTGKARRTNPRDWSANKSKRFNRRGIYQTLAKAYPRFGRGRRGIGYCQKADRLYGTVYFHKDKKIIIANCFSQVCGRTDIPSLRKVLVELSKYCETEKIKTIGIPYRYGSGLAVGDWDEILSWFKYYFSKSKVELQVWKLTQEEK